ncbi:MAG TPA: 50S ribosomal protein L9 [Spirochaetia bacterium]|nr:50S ribosomal protein L9 [Spirochaetia bacterium]
MKIILNKDVVNLGEEGDVREVAPGYGRNYLIPRGLAVAYSTSSVALFEGRRKAIEKHKEEKRAQAATLKDRIQELNLTIQVTTGETGRLFGSVNNATIMEELAKNGIEVERKRIEVPEHSIKQTGNYTVRVKLYSSETALLKVAVVDPNEQKRAAAAAKASAAQAVEHAEAHDIPPADAENTPEEDAAEESADADDSAEADEESDFAEDGESDDDK